MNRLTYGLLGSSFSMVNMIKQDRIFVELVSKESFILILKL